MLKLVRSVGFVGLIFCILFVFSGCFYYHQVPTQLGNDIEAFGIAGAPWAGPGTPWVYYGDTWYYNSVPYVFYAGYGWYPYGTYDVTVNVIRPNKYYGPRWNKWYHDNPHHWKQNFRPNIHHPRHHRYGSDHGRMPTGGAGYHKPSNVNPHRTSTTRRSNPVRRPGSIKNQRKNINRLR